MAAGDATHAPPAAEAQSLVDSFCAVTSATPDEATFFLEGHNWALEAAVRSFYDSTPMAPIPHPSPCSPPCSSPHATTSSTTSSIPASLRYVQLCSCPGSS
ncbi:plant UBX domain-containing protein 5-like [Triticum dicoccoides]|uniref:plant UBX domain-containing protein 5-like n=1 Tax=Triticum dicoccoides TaxID=85692 RepID=UPI001891B282|nr:plant UBX domain-containing protein 5-like [Triticum dicoccoides]